MNIVISCFDFSTNFVKPWSKTHLCYCIDTQHPLGETQEDNIIKVGADIRHWMPPKGNIVFAAFFPPCTHMSVSGARWFKGKGLFPLAESIELFAHSIRIAEYLDCPYFIENPVSTIASYWRKPDHVFDPCDYGDPWTKKTCLWTGNGFRMPPMKPVFPYDKDKIHKMPPSDDRANLRSETPMGFSNAIFKYHCD